VLGRPAAGLGRSLQDSNSVHRMRFGNHPGYNTDRLSRERKQYAQVGVRHLFLSAQTYTPTRDV
jgi:hypothetical protein